MKRLPWYKRDVDAWRGGTRGMSIELRGFYSECLDAMWDQQGPITKDLTKLSMMLCCNARTIRKLMPQLIALGKIVETENGYSNTRMSVEIEQANTSRPRTELKRNSIPTRTEFDAKVAKNPIISTRDLEVDKEEDKDKEENGRSQSVADRPSDELKSAFNGSTSNMLTDITKWMGVYGDEVGARKWLTGQLSAAGQQPTAEAYQMLLSAQAEGQVVSSPLRWWSKTASTLKAKGKPNDKAARVAELMRR